MGCRKTTSEPPPTPTDSVDLKSGLLLYLPFNGNFADSSGNNNPTVSLGATLSTDPNGNASSAMAGTGNGERVVVTNNGSIKFDSTFTVSVNVLTYSTVGQVFVDMTNKLNAEGVSFGVGIGTPGLTTVDFTVSDQRSSCTSVVSPNNSVTDTSNLTLPYATWHNLIAVFDRGTMSFYSNGTLISTKQSISRVVPVCPGSQVIVGGWWDGDPKSINGKIDEVRLYNRALNAREIAKMSEGFPILQPPAQPVADLKRGLLLYLPFNGSIADSSGNNNPTALVGGASLTNDEHGYPNSAFGDSGTGGRLIVTNNGSIKFDTAYTASFSFTVKDLSNQVFLSLVENDNAHGLTFNCGLNVPGNEQFEFGATDSVNGCDVLAEGSPYNIIDSTKFVPVPGSWYNVICAYHKGTITTYVNGKQISSKTGIGSRALNCPNAQFIVGGWWQNDPQSINGRIDNVRLYNRILLPEEIAMLSQYFQPTTNSIRQTFSR
ncbi:MAG TPA: LamG domain-containing protein [Puia sp.]|nr:LamG domain-containing protein [Puia sp.]